MKDDRPTSARDTLIKMSPYHNAIPIMIELLNMVGVTSVTDKQLKALWQEALKVAEL